jgi:hypothetical protein
MPDDASPCQHTRSGDRQPRSRHRRNARDNTKTGLGTVATFVSHLARPVHLAGDEWLVATTAVPDTLAVANAGQSPPAVGASV